MFKKSCVSVLKTLCEDILKTLHYSILMKIKVEVVTRSHRYDISRSRPRHGHRWKV